MQPNRLFLLSVIVLCWCTAARAQMPLEWENRINPGVQMQDFYQVAADSSGNTYTMMYVWLSHSLLMKKWGPQGQMIWSKQLGLTGTAPATIPYFMYYKYGHLWLIGQESDLATGHELDLFVRKIDTAGTEVFSWYYDYANIYYERPIAYCHNSRGDLQILVYANAWSTISNQIISLAANDTVLQWTTIFRPGWQYSLAQLGIDPHDNLYVGYHTSIPTTSHYTHSVLKFNSQGDSLWSYDSPDTSWGQLIQMGEAGNSLIVKHNGAPGPPFCIAVDSSGNVQWSRQIFTYSVNQIKGTPDGGWLMGGAELYPTIYKFDTLGNQVWRTVVPTQLPNNNLCVQIIFNPEDSLYYFIYLRSDGPPANRYRIYYIIRIRPDGALVGWNSGGFPMNQEVIFHGICGTPIPGGGFALMWRHHPTLGLISTTNISRFCANGCEYNFGGQIYADIDQDCTKDSLEPSVPLMVIDYDSTFQLMVADSAGRYRGRAMPGNHTVTITPLNGSYSGCPGTGTYAFQIDSLNPSSFGMDFGIFPPSTTNDVGVDLAISGLVRRATNNAHYLLVQNFGTVPQSGWLTYTMDTSMNLLQAFPQPDSLLDQVAKWRIPYLAPLSAQQLMIVTNTYWMTTIGANINTSLEFVNDSAETYLANNVDDFHTVLVAPYDPNMKEVEPVGLGRTGNIAYEDTVLTYTIHFQNVGNDTAFNVMVMDTISENLMIGSLHMVQASHPYTLTFYPGRIACWKFDNIQLPDSNHNYTESNGFLKYQIRVQPGLPIGTTIENTAGIYFDYNAPVITNTVLNTIRPEVLAQPEVVSSQPELRCYPNPAGTQFTVLSEEGFRGGEMEVVDLLGHVVYRSPCPRGAHAIAVDCSTWTDGIYFIRLGTAGNRDQLKVVVMHR